MAECRYEAEESVAGHPPVGCTAVLLRLQMVVAQPAAVVAVLLFLLGEQVGRDQME